MRALIQRVARAAVRVDGRVVGRIDRGLTILVGITHTDGAREATYLAEKALNMRIFPVEEGGTGFERSAIDIEADVLLVSQFTLYASTRKGRRPGFTDAAPGSVSEPVFEQVADAFRRSGLRVETGVFGARMLVELENDGPATIMLDTDDRTVPRRAGSLQAS